MTEQHVLYILWFGQINHSTFKKLDNYFSLLDSEGACLASDWRVLLKMITYDDLYSFEVNVLDARLCMYVCVCVCVCVTARWQA